MNDLEIILKHLEEERSILRKQLDRCLADLDYLGAHRFQEALMLKSSETMAIKDRLEGNRTEIRMCQHRASTATNSIDYIKDRLEQEEGKVIPNDNYLNSLREQLKDRQVDLDEINNQIIDLYQVGKLVHIDDDLLDSELERLLDGRSTALCLEIEQHEIYYITLFRLEGEIEVELVSAKLRKNSRRVSSYYKKHLMALGFGQKENYNWTLIKKQCHINKEDLLLIIARICFEVIRTTSNTSCKLMSVDQG